MDMIVFLHSWGLPLLALLCFAGAETAAVLAGLLAFCGILSWTAAVPAVLFSALLHDALLYLSARKSPEAAWVRSLLVPPLAVGAASGPVSAPASVLYRLAAKPKRFAPLAAASEGMTSARFFSFSIPAALIWTVFTLACGALIGTGLEHWFGSRTALWNRIAGVLLAAAVFYPTIRFILSYEISRIRQTGCRK